MFSIWGISLEGFRAIQAPPSLGEISDGWLCYTPTADMGNAPACLDA